MPDPAVAAARARSRSGATEHWEPSSSSANGVRRVFDAPPPKPIFRSMFGGGSRKKQVAWNAGAKGGKEASPWDQWSSTPALGPPIDQLLSSTGATHGAPDGDLSWMTRSERRAYIKEGKKMDKIAREMEKNEYKREREEALFAEKMEKEERKRAEKEWKEEMKAQKREEKERLKAERHALIFNERQLYHPNNLRRMHSHAYRKETSRSASMWNRKSTPMYGTLDLPIDGGGIPRRPPENVVWLPRFEDYGVRRLDGKGLPAGAEERGRIMSRTMTHALLELDHEADVRLRQRGFIY